MSVMVIPIVIGTLGTILKGLERGLEQLEIKGRIKIIQTTSLLRLARILIRVIVLADGLSPESEWQQVSLGSHDS